MNKEISDYLNQKQKNKLVPFQLYTNIQLKEKETAIQPSDKSIMQKFTKEKETYFNLARENLRLQLEIDMEKKIAENLQKNEALIIAAFKVIKNEIDTNTDLSRLDKNLEIMKEQFSNMQRELEDYL